jgi:hypothetical protein
MVVSTVLKNVVIGLILFFAMAFVWVWKDKEHYKEESKRQSENVSWQIKYDSLRFSAQVLSENEIKDHIVFNDPELKKKLEAANIKMSRIESLISQTLKYRDTAKRETDVSGLIEAIKNSVPKEQRWTDSSKCLVNSGLVRFDGEKLKVIVDDRYFNNESDGVAYWERNKWSFLGIKTRLFGKKVFTAKTFDECGESRILKIEKKK